MACRSWAHNILFNIWYRIRISFLRPVLELFQSGLFSRTEINGLSKILDQHLDYENGFFIEAGAWDGLLLSNTYFLERFRNWTGILVEPVAQYAVECAKNRPRSKVIHAALVGKRFKNASVALEQAGLATVVHGAMEKADEDKHIAAIRSVSPWVYKGPIVAPALTLNAVLQSIKPAKIDFLSLDVEGYEAEVLNGLDFTKFRPKVLLFEAQTEQKYKEVLGIIKKSYKTIEKVSDVDYLCY